ncbi:MAG: SdrD B-like domain-containing protein, partial [Pseudomonadota bacterium]
MSASRRRPRHHPKPISVSLRSCLTGMTGLLAGLVHGATAPEVATPQAAAQEVYVDRVIDGLSPADDALQLKADNYNTSGWPRSWRVDYSIFSQKGATQTQSKALGINGFLDTPEYGTLSVNSSTIEQQLDSPSTQTLGRGTTWRIDQRSVPLDGGWRANFSAGDINTGIVPMGRINGRISIPSTQIRGIAGQWYLGDTAEINVAKGPAGLFNELDVAGFDKLGGQLSSAGMQFKLPTDKLSAFSSRSDAAIQLIEGKDITSSGTGVTQNTRSAWMSTAWEGLAPWSSSLGKGTGPLSERVGGLRIQGNIIQSNSTIDGQALGLWADAVWRTERWRHAAGAYRFEPFLRWGTSALASDLQGVYWQADTSTRQWQAGFASEFSESVQDTGTGAPSQSVFFSSNARYRVDSRNALGATLNIKALAGSGQSLSMNWDRTGDWGQTQWRGDFANTVDGHTNRFSADHSWPIAAPTTLSTSLAWERTSGGTSPGKGLIWGVLGSWSPVPQWLVDGSIRGARRSDGSSSLNANVGLILQAQGGWSLSLRYTESRGKEPLQPLVVSALTTALLPIVQNTPANRSIQLILSYSARAGMASAPLGGVPGTGAGGLSGTVFFDADANGRREASEGGVPNITVILDRRYVTRTDTQGKYSFPFVAAGEHRIDISSDNVPLPWSPVFRDPVKIEVLVRDIT